MEHINILELIGYLASIIIAVSMTMTSVVKLRILNGIGALLFSIYGFFIGSYPVGILNGFITIINIYHLSKMLTLKETFEFQPVYFTDAYVKRFLEYYYNDIKKIFPNFDHNKSDYDVCLIMLRNMSVAGLFLASKSDDKCLLIELDYVIEKFRDLKNGHNLYKYLESTFKNESITFKSKPQTQAFSKYLTDIGFKVSENGTLVR